MVEDLAAFLQARLDEDEQTARQSAAEGGEHWRYEQWAERDGDSIRPDQILSVGNRVVNVQRLEGGTLRPGEAEHVARHDPARVLADVAAKRRILGEALDKADGGHEYYPPDDIVNDIRERAFKLVLEALALPYSDHPDYRDEWRP